MKIIGIDPGLTGAVAMTQGGTLRWVQDIPVLDGEIIATELAALLAEADIVYTEKVPARPKNGSVANFSMGRSAGTIEAVLGIMETPYVRVLPTEWKKKMGLLGKDKNASLALARQLFPTLGPTFKLAKHHNRAEAALIARFGVYDQVALSNA